MPDNWIRIIPEQPDLVPDDERQRRAISYFRRLMWRAAEIRVSVNDQIAFIDCGSNFENVACPSCGVKIDIDSWLGWMDEDFDGKGFTFSERLMPCCGVKHTLHELRYQFPQGFARFELSAMNPAVEGLTEDQSSKFEQILGCRVRIIHQRI
jgi:hypothetical protein